MFLKSNDDGREPTFFTSTGKSTVYVLGISSIFLFSVSLNDKYLIYLGFKYGVFSSLLSSVCITLPVALYTFLI